MELPREWYSIADLSERWECSREHIEHLFESKHLHPCCRFKTPINARLLTEGSDGMVVLKQIVRIEGQHVIVDYDLIEWNWDGGDMSRCRLYSQERDQFFLAVNHQIEKNELIVTNKAVLRFEAENNTKADTDDAKSLFKLAVEQLTRQMQKSNGGKKPKYMDIIKSLNKLSNNDDLTGAVILGVDFTGKEVCISDGNKIAFKTIQNWMSKL